MIRDDRPIPLTLSCQLVGGSNAIPQNVKPKAAGLRPHDRLSAGQKSMHNVKTAISMTSGLTSGGKKGVDQHRCYSKREMRALARKVLNSRGIPITDITDHAIAGILSGRTL